MTQQVQQRIPCMATRRGSARRLKLMYTTLPTLAFDQHLMRGVRQHCWSRKVSTLEQMSNKAKSLVVWLERWAAYKQIERHTIIFKDLSTSLEPDGLLEGDASLA